MKIDMDWEQEAKFLQRELERAALRHRCELAAMKENCARAALDYMLKSKSFTPAGVAAAIRASS